MENVPQCDAMGFVDAAHNNTTCKPDPAHHNPHIGRDLLLSDIHCRVFCLQPSPQDGASQTRIVHDMGAIQGLVLPKSHSSVWPTSAKHEISITHHTADLRHMLSSNNVLISMSFLIQRREIGREVGFEFV